jgi:amino acid transporter
MMYAFARDGGLPASDKLKRVNQTHSTPGTAIWTSAVLAIVATLYGNAFVVLSTGCAVFLYLSYILPVAAGILAEGKTWTHKGPFDLGVWSKPVALAAVVGGGVLAVVGMLPPNDKVLYLTIGLLVGMALYWWVLGERNRFKGPPKVQE